VCLFAVSFSSLKSDAMSCKREFKSVVIKVDNCLLGNCTLISSGETREKAIQFHKRALEENAKTFTNDFCFMAHVPWTR
jgi:hypothetical protein